MSSIFDSSCRRCTRLAAFLDSVRHQNPEYYCKPGGTLRRSPRPALLIVGLAPGMHGANRTGRPFTGDFAGILLYGTLHKFGLASAPRPPSSADDGLRSAMPASPIRSNACRRQNKPLPQEIKKCNAYLEAELAQSPEVRVILALGAIAHAAVLRAHGLHGGRFQFAHAAEHASAEAGCCWIPIIAAATTPRPAVSRRPCSRTVIEQGASPPGRSRSARAMTRGIHS